MDYQQTLDYLYSQLPMFQRIGPAAYKANLDNTWALAHYLDNPQDKFTSVHIAGTNGKGSVAHMLASVFQQAGYKTGLCTSPHLRDFRERFRINGQLIPKEFVTDFIASHKPFFETLKPSFFELTIAMTFDFFAKEKVDIAIVETGLGGRLDSTNIVTPELSVITNIGFDHMNLLGNTLEQIAFEKAGIIKQDIPVVIGKARPQAKKVFSEMASKRNAPILFTEDICKVEKYGLTAKNGKPLLCVDLSAYDGMYEICSDLTGNYQVENLSTAFVALQQLMLQGRYNITMQDVKVGLMNVMANTGIAGRWQKLSEKPLMICDTAHNEDGIRYVLENLRNTPHRHLHFVLGMMNDKDVQGILRLLPVENTTYYYCKPDVPRGLESTILAEEGLKAGLKGIAYGSVSNALAGAKASAQSDDLVFVGGSTFVVAEVV